MAKVVDIEINIVAEEAMEKLDQLLEKLKEIKQAADDCKEIGLLENLTA